MFCVRCFLLGFFFLKRLLLLMDGFLSIFRQKLRRQHVGACFKESDGIVGETQREERQEEHTEEERSLCTDQESENAWFCVESVCFERW